MTDVPSVIQVCVVIHEKYSDFAPQLLEAWQKVLSLKKDEKVCFICSFFITFEVCIIIDGVIKCF